ncbi:Ubiquitin-conjugating enzyme subunit [Hanseniaspora opuntiae]
MDELRMKKTAASVIAKQFKQLTDPKTAIPYFNVELSSGSNLFSWNVGIMIDNEESIYNGGYLKGMMTFPIDYPYSPPTFRFVPAIYHPNIYKDGRVCISILHQSGDETSGEPDNETWSPVQTAETVLMSIISLLEDPNLDSPANVDAAVDLKKSKKLYEERVLLEVKRSQLNIPKDFLYKKKVEIDNLRNNISTQDGDQSNSPSVHGSQSATNTAASSSSSWFDPQQKKKSFWHDSDVEDEELEVEFSESDEE